jgi:two-component system sensor histidine kinase KdpD
MVRASGRQWLLWIGILAATVALLLPFRGQLEQAHIALLLLLVVLGGSAVGGRLLGITLALAAFLAFDVGFLLPFNTVRVSHIADWLVLIVFLVTGIVAAELLEREQHESAIARAQMAEIIRLARSEDEAIALRRADRLKDALLASVSHDLRTPLTAIKGIANEIARGEDPMRAVEIEEEVDRLTAQVNDLLDLSQLAAGEMAIHAAVNTADDAVGSALQRVEVGYPERSFVAVLEEPWIDLVGRFDIVQTMRILTNLLENAAKYAPAASSVRLHVWREASTLRFAVEDDGPGVHSPDRERMFEPFVRGPDRSAGIRGTGLGLSIARRLAEAQGGRLEYAPSEVCASRFVLSLPAADVPAI